VDESGIPKSPYGHTAYNMAAAIKLPTHDDQILLTIGKDDPIALGWESGVTYNLLLENDFMWVPELCSPYEAKRNDFHFNREMLDLGNRPQLTLKVDHCDASDPCTTSSDAAPCMGAGYGKSNGLP
jgi:hypothetical protein